jgi:hypothetical protein
MKQISTFLLTPDEAKALGMIGTTFYGSKKTLLDFADQMCANWEDAPRSPSERNFNLSVLRHLMGRVEGSNECTV